MCGKDYDAVCETKYELFLKGPLIAAEMVSHFCVFCYIGQCIWLSH